MADDGAPSSSSSVELPALPLDVPAIERILPHRAPFLLLDRVVELTADHIVAIKNVTYNEPFFAGHFPGNPVMPGVLILEALAQAGGVLALVNLGAQKRTIYFLGLDKVKFRQKVVPGDQLRLRVEPLRRGGSVWKLRGDAFVGETLVAECEFLATLAKDPPKE
jgi:3-hydroxyacyl-[acyl-carrier-protein] dehydratase/UDP-3-O-[3-hydroxymyristoyl] N-acetylglucosamine deacetylase/3-hydroxyacyl-[acyl-carrier-protein] dehydratase